MVLPLGCRMELLHLTFYRGLDGCQAEVLAGVAAEFLSLQGTNDKVLKHAIKTLRGLLGHEAARELTISCEGATLVLSVYDGCGTRRGSISETLGCNGLKLL